MSFEIETTGKFDREIKRLVKKYPSLKIEFANLISQLKAVPHTGVLTAKYWTLGFPYFRE